MILFNGQFQRWGDLSPVKQKGYNPSMPTFHSPPARRGIYAFPRGHIEGFLLGRSVFDHRLYKKTTITYSQYVNDPKLAEIYSYSIQWKSEKTKDFFNEHWETMSEEEYNQYHNKNCYICKLKTPKIFSHNGPLWHHLHKQTNQKDIIKSKGEWILTQFQTYKKAIIKEIGNWKYRKNSYLMPYSKDHIEVFIEKIKN
jgi:hypothetical protein